MASSDLETKAKEAFIDDNFELAVELYSLAINLSPNNAELYIDRAQANIKLRNFTEAVADANKAIECEPSMAKAYLRKGIVCIKLEEYQTAKTALDIGASLAPGDSRFTNLIKECDERIAEEAEELPTQLDNRAPMELVAFNDLPASAALPSQVTTESSTKPKYCAHGKTQREAMEVVERGGKMKKLPKNLGLEDYLNLLDSHRLDNLTIANLHQIISMHGFVKQKQHKSILIDAVSTMELINLCRSTLQNGAISGVGASLTLEEVIMDLNDINWQECHVTSLITQGATSVKRKRSRSIKKRKSVKKIIDNSSVISVGATVAAESTTDLTPSPLSVHLTPSPLSVHDIGTVVDVGLPNPCSVDIDGPPAYFKPRRRRVPPIWASDYIQYSQAQ